MEKPSESLGLTPYEIVYDVASEDLEPGLGEWVECGVLNELVERNREQRFERRFEPS